MKYFLIALLILFLPNVSNGADLPRLLDCNCETWNNYDANYAEFYENDLRVKGYKISQTEFDNYKTQGLIGRQDYIAGLIAAFTYLYENSPRTEASEYYRFPYRVGEYVTEIDFYCKDPKHKNEEITEVLLKVNYSLKHK